MADIVRNCSSAIVNRDAGIAGAEQNLAARFQITGFFYGSFKRTDDKAKRFLCKDFPTCMGIAVCGRFKRMNKGIEPAPGGEVCRQRRRAERIRDLDVGRGRRGDSPRRPAAEPDRR